MAKRAESGQEKAEQVTESDVGSLLETALVSAVGMFLLVGDSVFRRAFFRPTVVGSITVEGGGHIICWSAEPSLCNQQFS